MNVKEPAQESTDIEPDSDRSQNDDGEASGPPGKEREIGGRKGPDPTRYGDWEKAGRCIDF